MNVSVLGVFLCGFCLLSGVGVDSQLLFGSRLEIGLPGTRLILGTEDIIMNILLGGRAFFNLGRNFGLTIQEIISRGGGGGGVIRNSVGKLGTSLRSLASAVVNLVSGNTRVAGQLFLRMWRLVNTVIANIIRAVRRAAVRVAIDLITGKLRDRIKDRPFKLKNILNNLRPLRLLSKIRSTRPHILGRGLGLLDKLFGGKRIKKLVDLIVDFIKNRVRNAANNAINNVKNSIKSIPRKMVDTALRLGIRLRTRPKLLQRLIDRLRDIMRNARRLFFDRLKDVRSGLVRVIFNLSRALINFLLRIKDRLRNGIFNILRTIPNALGRLGGRLRTKGPFRSIIGLIIQGLSNRLRAFLNGINSILSGIQGIIRGIYGVVRDFIFRRLNLMFEHIFTSIVARRVVRRNKLLSLVFGLIPRPVKTISNLLPRLVLSGRVRRVDRRRRILDRLRDLLSKIGSLRPKPLQNLRNRLRNVIRRRPIRGGLTVVTNIRKDIRQILSGFVRILIQIMSGSRLGGSLIIRIIRQFVGGGRRSPLARIATLINTATALVQRFTGLGGVVKIVTGIVSALLYVFEPFLRL